LRLQRCRESDVRPVQTNLLLYKETPISSLEEAQEDVQGTD